MGTTTQENKGGTLVLSREAIVEARGRSSMPSDGGSTGVSDTND